MTHTKKTVFAALLAFGLAATPALAEGTTTTTPAGSTAAIAISAPVSVGDLEITRGYVRAMPAGAKAGGGFISITNKGTTNDTLIAASCPDAGQVQLHTMKVENGIMVMREMQNGIPVPAGETVKLAPGGLHLMFLEVPKSFEAGQTLAVTLTFKKAGTVTLDMPVISMAQTMQMKAAN